MSAIENKVSVIIVTHNSRPALDECLSGLKAGLNGNGHEIIGVDNASSDSSQQAVREHFPQARVVANRRNVGFASACNEGARIATGEYLMFLNPDATIDSDAIEQLVVAIKSRDDAGVVVGRMRFPDGSFQATCRKLPRLDNMLFSRGSIFSRLLRNGSHYTLPDYPDTTAVEASAGTMMMIRRELFEKVGGFDRRFFMFMEDVDLCLRLSALGHTNYFVPSAGAVHLWGRGSNVGKLRRNWYHHWAVWKYFRKHRRSLMTYTLLPLVLVVNFVLVTLLPVSQPANRR